MKKISILIPVYNEQDVLAALYERVSAVINANDRYLWEVVLVNDGSTDNTALMAMQMRNKDKRFHFVDLSRNFGKETAMMAGFDVVTGDCVVIMDADLQHPPEVIPDMVAKWEEGYDDVYGERITRGKEPWIRKKISLLYYKLLQRTTKTPILENVGDFRLLDRTCIDALRQLREIHRYTKGLYCYIGFKKGKVPFEQADRESGSTKWNFMSLLGLAIEGLTSYTTVPLRLATIVGSLVSFGAIIYLIYIIIKTIIVGEPVAGFPTLMVAILLLGGITLLSIGIIGEYVGRIFNETKNRPNYFIREIDGVKKTTLEEKDE